MIQDNEKIDNDIVRKMFRIAALILMAVSGFFLIIKVIIYFINTWTLLECAVCIVLGWIILLITERKGD